MGMLDAFAARVAAGAEVSFRPTGTSMVPLIRSRQSVTVVPVDPAKLEVGDIVLVRTEAEGGENPRVNAAVA